MLTNIAIVNFLMVIFLSKTYTQKIHSFSAHIYSFPAAQSARKEGRNSAMTSTQRGWVGGGEGNSTYYINTLNGFDGKEGEEGN